MAVTLLERRERSAVQPTGRQLHHSRVCLLHDPSNTHLLFLTLACKGQGWGSGLVYLQPPSLLQLMPWFTLSLPPFSQTRSLTSCTCPSAVPRDCLKNGVFWKKKDPLFHKNVISICCFQRFPWLITPSTLSALPLLHLHQLLLSRCHKARSPVEEEQQPAPAMWPPSQAVTTPRH